MEMKFVGRGLDMSYPRSDLMDCSWIWTIKAKAEFDARLCRVCKRNKV